MIRDTRTGVSALMKASMLNHPAFKDFFQEVRTDKLVKNVPAIKVEKKESSSEVSDKPTKGHNRIFNSSKGDVTSTT